MGFGELLVKVIVTWWVRFWRFICISCRVFRVRQQLALFEPRFASIVAKLSERQLRWRQGGKRKLPDQPRSSIWDWIVLLLLFSSRFCLLSESTRRVNICIFFESLAALILCENALPVAVRASFFLSGAGKKVEFSLVL